jgi:hypothetical protein
VVEMVGTDVEIAAMMRPCPECDEVDCICPDPEYDETEPCECNLCGATADLTIKQFASWITTHNCDPMNQDQRCPQN